MNTALGHDPIHSVGAALLGIGFVSFLTYCVLGYNRHRRKSWRDSLRALLIFALSSALVGLVILLIWSISSTRIFVPD